MKLFLAGLFSGLEYFIPPMQQNLYAPYLLGSFAYAKNKVNRPEAKELIKHSKQFLLDSGAFSFMNGKDATKQELIQYLKQYIRFINDYNFKYVFELDVDVLVGLPTVEDFRKALMTETNAKVIPVWHKSRGLKYWERMIDEFDFIAFGGIAIKVINLRRDAKYIRAMVRLAHKKHCWVHGLGAMRMDVLKWKLFDSVDSTTWRMSAVNGKLDSFIDGKIIKRTLARPGLRANLEKLQAHNIIPWIEFAKYLDEEDNNEESDYQKDG